MKNFEAPSSSPKWSECDKECGVHRAKYEKVLKPSSKYSPQEYAETTTEKKGEQRINVAEVLAGRKRKEIKSRRNRGRE
jgi:hypothetical protein